MMATADLNAARLRELFNYDENTGSLTWAVKRGPAQPGDAAGIVSNRGHIKVKVHGKSYQAHRIIWAMVTGEWPPMDVDHRDCNKTNNRWANLRLASASMNAQNICRPRKSNTSGFLGVYTLKAKPGWFFASIKLGGASVQLGAWTRPEPAHKAYIEAKRQMHIGCTI